jgi:hypothetical protein
MITKKWVEETVKRLIDERIAEHNKDDVETLNRLEKDCGWTEGVFFTALSPAFFSVHDRIEALYKHLGLTNERKFESSCVITKKIKK